MSSLDPDKCSSINISVNQINLQKSNLNPEIIGSDNFMPVSQTVKNVYLKNKTKNSSTKRCNHPDCRKKIKLTDTKCRCELLFCPIHRLPEYHNCNINYKTEGKKILENKLIKVDHQKIIKI